MARSFSIRLLQIVSLLSATLLVRVYSGQLHWLKASGIETAYFESNFDLDCRLSSSDVHVTFKHHTDFGLVAITPDGKKHVKIDNQTLRIVNLDDDDAQMYECEAEGIKNKQIDLFVTDKPEQHQYSAEISSQETEIRKKCAGRLQDERKIICKATGRGTLTLRKKSPDGKWVSVLGGTMKNDYIRGHSVQIYTYTFPDVLKKDEGYYRCAIEPNTKSITTAWSREFFLAVLDEAPKVKTFRPTVAKEGQRVVMKCKPTAKKRPPDSIAYFINGISVTDPAYRSRYTPACQKLIIPNVRFPDDNVTFTCKIKNKYGFAVRNASLLVLVKPVIDKSVSAVVERNVPIHCKVTRSNPQAVISWQMQPYCLIGASECWPQARLWKDISGDQFTITTTNGSSQLIVSPSHERDYFFRCIARNRGGNDSHVVKFLHLRNAPNLIEIFSKESSFNEKETFALTCASRKGIFSNLTWLKDGAVIRERPKFSERVETSMPYPVKSVLTITNATLNITGNYTCVGKEIRGDTRVASVIVTIKRIFAPIISLTVDEEPSEGDTVVLHCNVISNPAAEVYWYKNNREIRINETSLISDESQCSSTVNGYYFKLEKGQRLLSHLIICEVSFIKNNGTYSCRAQNSLGSTRASTFINVLKKPTISLNKDFIFVGEGESIYEICNATGNPKPMVYWRMKSSGKLMSTQKYGSSTLKIGKDSKDIYGTYECFAWSSLGNTSSSMQIKASPLLLKVSAQNKSKDPNKHTNLYILLVTVFTSTIFIIVCIFVLLRRRKIYGGFYIFSSPPNPDHLRNIDPTRALIEQTNGLPYDPVWEFPRKRIRLLDRLGSGAFGDVYLAEAVGIVCFEPRERISMKQRPLIGRKRSRSGSTSSRTGSSYRRLVTKVAIKKLKENASPEEMRDLVSELKILIHIGEHSNIVNLLGACTKGGEKDLMVILEYAPHGNLLSFLKSRRQILKTTWKKDAVGMENELTTCDLAVIAYQVAKGMEFLASRRCVHRDLAARNVLVGEGYVMKIADFGLARDIYKDDRYVKLSAGLLPIKWMAIEAIQERIFTHQSDIWSYGILLWEIMTMGGSPYPGLPVRGLLDYLTSGYRMEQPIYCPDEIYALMRDCWIENPDDRPIFTEIVGRSARIIEAHIPAEECFNYLDQIHCHADGYLRPVESPRSPTSVLSPPPTYSAFINQRDYDNRFFGSDVSIENVDSCKKLHEPDVVLIDTKRLSSVSEIKAKKDAAQKEKKGSESSSLPENESEDEEESPQASAKLPLMNKAIFFSKDDEKISFYDSDKDVDEVELENGLLGQQGPYINQPKSHIRENPYLNR